VVAILIFLVVITVIAGTTLTNLNGSYRKAFQAAAWQEALNAAEAGVDLAMKELRNTVAGDESAWTGWTDVEGRDGEGGTEGNPLTGNAAYHTSETLIRIGGRGGARSMSKVIVEAPDYLKDSRGNQWYRVRSLGSAEIPSQRIVTGTRSDNRLRRLFLQFDEFKTAGNETMSGAEDPPRAVRMLEIIARPTMVFQKALLADEQLDFMGNNVKVDSYDSSDPDKSTGGQWDPDKAQENGDIATNGDLIDVGNANIKGDASVNQGDIDVGANGEVTGEQYFDFYQDLPPVLMPEWAETATSTSVSGTTKIYANATESDDYATVYKFDNISLSGSEVLTIEGDTSDTPEPRYIEIVVTGEIDLSGQAKIIMGDNVYARVFFAGDVDLSGQGIVFQQEDGSEGAAPRTPVQLQMYGLVGEDGRDVKFVGNAGFGGTVYAPQHDISFSGGGNDDIDISGAFVGKNITLNGHFNIHYDETLAKSGLIYDYKIASWVEDYEIANWNTSGDTSGTWTTN